MCESLLNASSRPLRCIRDAIWPTCPSTLLVHPGERCATCLCLMIHRQVCATTLRRSGRHSCVHIPYHVVQHLRHAPVRFILHVLTHLFFVAPRTAAPPICVCPRAPLCPPRTQHTTISALLAHAGIRAYTRERWPACRLSFTLSYSCPAAVSDRSSRRHAT